MTVELVVDRTWDGVPLPADQRAVVQLDAHPRGLVVRGLAPWAGDPPPDRPPGSTPGLWNHEVLELFLVGADGRYLEVELGPHGHHLVLQLAGVRRPAATELPLDVRVARLGGRWLVEAELPSWWLPRPVVTANAYRIHGPTGARVYHAATALPGAQPDFHQPHRFAPITTPAAPAPPRLAAARLLAALDPEPAGPGALPDGADVWQVLSRAAASGHAFARASATATG